MSHSGESRIIEWLTAQPIPPRAAEKVVIGIGDDMACLTASGRILITTDMLLDGVHFDRAVHDLPSIGRKAIACSLSDCAAMAVRPIAAAVSLALPKDWTLDDTKQLYAGIRSVADEFDCAIVGGDTTAWDQRLAVDVAMIATPYDDCEPVRRSSAKPGDIIHVTGPLGGSILGRHLTFTPRVREAHAIAVAMGGRLHAMMDISDGLSLDLHRLCTASAVGAELDEEQTARVISPAAVELSQRDGVSPLEHALSDGEDFELLIVAAPDSKTSPSVRSAGGDLLHPVGRITERGFEIVGPSGRRTMQPRGYEHLT